MHSRTTNHASCIFADEVRLMDTGIASLVCHSPSADTLLHMRTARDSGSHMHCLQGPDGSLQPAELCSLLSSHPCTCQC
jgi:hypothetical protein